MKVQLAAHKDLLLAIHAGKKRITVSRNNKIKIVEVEEQDEVEEPVEVLPAGTDASSSARKGQDSLYFFTQRIDHLSSYVVT